MAQMQLLQTPLDEKDIVYTPDWVAKDMVEFFNPSGVVLDPCRGDGAFTKYLPNAEWCEIQEGKDFFAWNTPVDWVVGNPPYKQFAKWFEHSKVIAQNILYVLPCNKPFNSYLLIENSFFWGKACHMRYYGVARQIFSQIDLGFSVGAFHFQKGYFGPMYSSMAENVPNNRFESDKCYWPSKSRLGANE